MPIYTVELHLKRAEVMKAINNGPKLIANCLDSIDASLWLIAGGRLPQALVLVLNAIEIAFKGELERIHRILIADIRRCYVSHYLTGFVSLSMAARDGR